MREHGILLSDEEQAWGMGDVTGEILGAGAPQGPQNGTGVAVVVGAGTVWAGEWCQRLA